MLLTLLGLLMWPITYFRSLIVAKYTLADVQAKVDGMKSDLAAKDAKIQELEYQLLEAQESGKADKEVMGKLQSDLGGLQEEVGNLEAIVDTFMG